MQNQSREWTPDSPVQPNYVMSRRDSRLKSFDQILKAGNALYQNQVKTIDEERIHRE